MKGSLHSSTEEARLDWWHATTDVRYAVDDHDRKRFAAVDANLRMHVNAHMETGSDESGQRLHSFVKLWEYTTNACYFVAKGIQESNIPDWDFRPVLLRLKLEGKI